MFDYSPRRFSYQVLLAPALIAALVGCRGRAQRDMYEAKMAHEIRVLEDQLYEADYHNRVLIDKLERVRLKSEPASSDRQTGRDSYESTPKRVPPPQPSAAGDSPPQPLADPVPNGASGLVPPELPDLSDPDVKEAPDGRSTPSSTDDLSDLGVMIDEGQPVDAAEIASPEAPQNAPVDPGKSSPNRAVPPAGSPSRDTNESGELLPAPGGPEPPGKKDTELSPVLPGEVLPPSTLDGDEPDNKPPGQIVLPDSAQDGSGIPDQVRIHPSLSGGQRVDGQVNDMRVVLNVLDLLGRPLDLSQYDVAAELSLVMFEADQPSGMDEGARIGRWDFTAEQVLEFVRSEPISGLHVPIVWQGRQPQGSEIIVHIRLRAADDEMRCESRIRVERSNAVAEWTPRGEPLPSTTR